MPNSGFKKGHKPWNTGLTKEIDVSLLGMGQRHSLKMKGRTVGPMPQSRKIKIGDSNRGKVRSPEIIEAARQRFLLNCPTKRADVKQKISSTMVQKFTDPLVRLEYGLRFGYHCGDKHPNWKGGSSKEPYGIEFSKHLREFIRERDKHTCAVCAEGGRFVHHIDYDKKNNSVKNLITVCNPCHGKTGTKKKRDYWMQYSTNHLEVTCGYT